MLDGLLLVVLADSLRTARQRRKAVMPESDILSGPEAQHLREALQSTREEMQTSQEELTRIFHKTAIGP